MGIQNAVANLSGAVAPVVSLHSVQATGHYTVALVIAGSVAFLGALTWLLIVPPVRAVEWAEDAVAA